MRGDSKEARELKADSAIHAGRTAQKIEKRTRIIMQLAKEKVLHISAHFSKTDKRAIIQLLEELIKTQQTESAYLFEIPLADREVFEVFVKMLQQQRMLSFLNIGEIQLSEHQMERLKAALKKSTVTHMFYECNFCSADDKVELRGIVRANQRKHKRWIYKRAGGEGNDTVINEMEKCWFNPKNHAINELAIALKVEEERCSELTRCLTMGWL